jgi:hypothetical protein
MVYGISEPYVLLVYFSCFRKILKLPALVSFSSVYDREEEHQNQGEPRYPADITNPIVAEMHHHVYSLGSLVGYGKHLRVDHGNDEFGKGRKHINGIEVFWGMQKHA